MGELKLNNENWYTCKHCGNAHYGVCHRIKSIEYYENGTVKKIEYKQEEIAWPPISKEGYVIETPEYELRSIWTY